MRPAAALVADPRFARVCEALAEEARAGFAAADDALMRLDRAALKPAILMMESLPPHARPAAGARLGHPGRAGCA